MGKVEDYKGKVEQWIGVEAQDEAYNLPVRPFPMVEFNALGEPDENGRELPDRTSPVTTPLFTREVSADGKVWVIRTPRKYVKPGGNQFHAGAAKVETRKTKTKAK